MISNPATVKERMFVMLDGSETYLIVIAPVKKQPVILEQVGGTGCVAGRCVCDNVYQATAEIHNFLSDNDKLVIALVWADNLTLGQMELFSLLKENSCVITLAISENNESKLQTALKAGADRAMLLENIQPGLFDSIALRADDRITYDDDEAIISMTESEEEMGSDPFSSDDLSDFDEGTYRLKDEVKSEILEIPAEKAGNDKGDHRRDKKETNKSQMDDNKELTDISLSEDELKSLLDED